MYFRHFSTETISQNSSIPEINWSLVFGFTSLLKYSYSLCQRFSIVLMSGDSAGVFHQFMLSFSNHCCAFLEVHVCFGSLSCINLQSLITSLIKGFNPRSKILMYLSAFIFPSNITDELLPSRLIPVHICTCTFAGCFGLQIKKKIKCNLILNFNN